MPWWEVLLRLLLAAVVAGVIGLDRELRAKPAGLRTNLVVGLAAAAFGIVSESAFDVTRGYDPSRVAAEVVSGIGFIGAGVIFAARGRPHGLTTAAAMWGAAAAGLAVGVGEEIVGIGVAVITWVALLPLDWIGNRVLRGRRKVDVVVLAVVDDLPAAQRVRAAIREARLSLGYLDLDPFGPHVRLAASLRGSVDDIAEVVVRLQDDHGVRFVSEERVASEER